MPGFIGDKRQDRRLSRMLDTAAALIQLGFKPDSLVRVIARKHGLSAP